MVEAIADPLVHMVRNAADHGIETPEERERLGKPRQGRILLRAAHEGGSVIITLADDGRGLNPAKIRAKAVERGLIEPGATLTEAEIQPPDVSCPASPPPTRLPTFPGAVWAWTSCAPTSRRCAAPSTSSRVPGSGSTFSFRLPLTLAIIDGMVIRVGASASSCRSSPSPKRSGRARRTSARCRARRELVTLRGALLPVCRLGRLLGVADAGEN